MGIDEAPDLPVQSTTTDTPHPADESSAPGPYTDLPINRPPVSTNDAETPIAHSLVAGAGAGDQNVGEPEEEKNAARAVEYVEPKAAKSDKER